MTKPTAETPDVFMDRIRKRMQTLVRKDISEEVFGLKNPRQTVTKLGVLWTEMAPIAEATLIALDQVATTAKGDPSRVRALRERVEAGKRCFNRLQALTTDPATYAQTSRVAYGGDKTTASGVAYDVARHYLQETQELVSDIRAGRTIALRR